MAALRLKSWAASKGTFASRKHPRCQLTKENVAKRRVP
jgi:hypothetical protein